MCRSNCCHLCEHAPSFSATLALPLRAAAAIKAALQAHDRVITPPKEEIDHGGPSNNHNQLCLKCVCDSEHDGITTAPGVSNQISDRWGQREAVPGIV